ncbi:hypothetical protein HMPREF9306_01204 [Propionimicrobium lymphophilum ACS-093-V-SCH5]|uniref:Uncharacterized protein n=1 Tax=Propionimicrobium lymphophilum ACS-093-V-SCH5 TaxID=883161 RepID=S2W178_9ACTN|nr:hypothetical protein [Propionimicrobium lymphophilum]EPD32896.1 hypothetical protein HMPREF9306_01204 [Propionimicrobium lymphophilum ACS-093-V-SCH5]
MSIRELAHVDSACTVGDARAGVRVDPFWSGLWRSGLGSAWWDRKLLASHVDAGLVRDGAFNMDQGQAFESFCCGGGGPVWSGRLRGLAGLGSWRVVTNQQLAAVSGFSGWASASSSTVRAGFGAGLLRMGLFAGGVPSSSTGPVFLLRPGSEKVFGHLSRRLSYWDWLSITGGLPWRVGGLFPRHNVLMSELGLLAAELLPQEFGLSFGERWSGTDQLLGAHGNKSGDGLLVRDDGLRVVVELTASAAPALEQKVDAWASLLARNRLASSGVVVVFVVAAPDKSDRVARRTRKVVRSAIARYGLSGNAGQADQQLMLGIGGANVATIADWPRGADEVFTSAGAINRLRGDDALPANFAFIAGASERPVSADIFLRAVNYASTKADMVVVDTQVVDTKVASTADSMVSDFMLPLWRGGAFGLGLMEPSSKGASNLHRWMRRLADVYHLDMSNQMVAVNKMPYSLDVDTDQLEEAFSGLGRFVGSAYQNDQLFAAMSFGGLSVDDENLAGIASRVVYRMFPDKIGGF